MLAFKCGAETYHCHMMVDPHVQKTHSPRQDNSGTCPGPMSKKQSPREMIIVGRARSPCRKSTLLNRRPSPSPPFWLSFLWCFSLVSVRGGAFLLFQFAVIFSLVSACCGAFSRLSQDNRGTRSGPMSKKHPPRRTPVALSPLLIQFAVELYSCLRLL